MVQYIPPPDARNLLEPLLACLPTAFSSRQPPPALLPLLSPILRQRVQFLSGSLSGSDSWLPLLSWDQQRASKLPGIIERLNLEPHPMSGEIELPEIDAVEYRRQDEETLHTRLKLGEFELVPIYLWCMTDAAGGGNGWRLAELRALEDQEDGTKWYPSITEADERAKESYIRDAVSAAESGNTNGVDGAQEKDEDDDDAYWAAYDRTPGRTPARTPAKRSPAPNSSVQMPTTSELEYFARYMSEVQPAMDPHDPAEEGLGPEESTLQGNELSRGLQVPPPAQTAPTETTSGKLQEQEEFTAAAPVNGTTEDERPERREVHSPQPRSPSSSSGSVQHLEQAVENQSQAEIGIKQHISTDIKSLFRLARAVGIDRAEFTRIVNTELQMLEMMDLDE